MNNLEKIFYLTVSFLFLVLGYVFNKGIFFHQSQLWLLFISWLFLFIPLIKKRFIYFNFELNFKNILFLITFIIFILFYFFDGGIYFLSKQGEANLILLKFLALLFFCFYLFNFHFFKRNVFTGFLIHLKRHKFIYLIILALALRLLVLFYSPMPKIDVFWFSDGAAESFLQGDNPYSQTYFKVYEDQDYVNNFFAYWPVTIFVASFFKLFFGDVRFAYIFCQMVTALLAYLLVKKVFNQKKIIAELITLLLLYTPLSLFVIEQTWVEPLMVLLIYLFVWFWLIGKKTIASFVLGLFLGVKQLGLMIGIFITRLNSFKLKQILITFFVLLIIIVPFILWQPIDFFNDTIAEHFLSNKIFFHSLSFNSLWNVYFYSSIPAWFYLPVLLILFLWLWFKSKKNLFGVIYAGVFFLFSLFLLRQSFLNYYWGISQLIILLIIGELRLINKKHV